MATKKRVSFAGRLGQTVSDMANAASVAATGSEIGVLELAAEDELNVRPATCPRDCIEHRRCLGLWRGDTTSLPQHSSAVCPGRWRT